MNRELTLWLTLTLFPTIVSGETVVFDSNAVIAEGDSYDVVAIEGDHTVVTMTGGMIKEVLLTGSAVLDMEAGIVDELLTYGTSTATISGGDTCYIECYNRSKVALTGECYVYGVMAYANSEVSVAVVHRFGKALEFFILFTVDISRFQAA